MTTDTDYAGWCTIRGLSAGVDAGDYILTPADLDYDTKTYSDISEAEERIKRDLRSDAQEVNIRMAYYSGNEYKLSAETLNAVRESGKDLNITFPGVEASATYMWTFHGSEMGEVTAPVDLIVRFPVSGDVVEAVNGKITNDAGTLMLDFQQERIFQRLRLPLIMQICHRTDIIITMTKGQEHFSVQEKHNGIRRWIRRLLMGKDCL